MSFSYIVYLTDTDGEAKRQEELVPAETEGIGLNSATTMLCIISSLIYHAVVATTRYKVGMSAYY